MPTLKSSNNKKRIGITLGDPAGIGTEVTVKALSKSSISRLADFYIIGHRELYKKYSRTLSSKLNFIEPEHISLKNIKNGKPNKHSGTCSLAYLNRAVKLIKEKHIDSLVTAPICKEAIIQSIPSFIGHTEFLAQEFKIKNVGMMFVAPNLKTILVTRHIPLKKVSNALTKEEIYETIVLTHTALKDNFKIRAPRIGVCGVNPHAGENGTLGKEEQEIVIPAIQKAKKNNIQAFGPFAADTLFSKSTQKSFDCVVAMYHDQGLIPIKTLYFDQLVNLTVGLPFIRTSPAHGTAFDIAGKNKANEGSMCAAIKLAVELS